MEVKLPHTSKLRKKGVCVWGGGRSKTVSYHNVMSLFLDHRVILCIIIHGYSFIILRRAAKCKNNVKYFVNVRSTKVLRMMVMWMGKLSSSKVCFHF